ncbi:MAG: response regulator [Planctomycetes bacterium]|nr:response regulator [Planctomycetota bacterium]
MFDGVPFLLDTDIVMRNASNSCILYIENDPVFCDLFKVAVMPHGYSVDTAHDEIDGWALYKKKPYDLIVIGYLTPEIFGIDFAQKLLSDNQDLPILIVTRREHRKIASEALSLGIVEYVIKDDEYDYLETIPGFLNQLLLRAARRNERKQSEEALLTSEKRYRALFLESPLGISVEDYSGVKLKIDRLKAEGVEDFFTYFAENEDVLAAAISAIKIIDANNRQIEMFGSNTLEEYMNYEVEYGFVCDSQWREYYINEFSTYASGGITYSGEAMDFRADGSPIEVRCTSRIIKSADGNWAEVISTHEDITERKHLEEKLRQSQRMEAVGQLTGGVAHDFNNLLGVMLGNTEMLEDRLDGSDKAKFCVGALKGAIKRAASLINRLLAFSRQQTLIPESTDVTMLVGGLEEILLPTLGETINLKIKTGIDLWLATIDKNQFENALLNLAINARDAMPQGGMLTIEIDNATLDETYSEHHENLMPGDYVVRPEQCLSH